MYGPVLELVPHSCQKHLKLRRLPSQCASKQADADALIALGVVEDLIFADLLELLVFWPGVNRDFEIVLLDVHEASFFYPIPVIGVMWNRLFILLRRFDDELDE